VSTYERQQIWQAVDQLSRPAKRPVVLDDGTSLYVLVPSLWEQAEDALRAHRQSGRGYESATSERAPIDLDLMQLCAVIKRVTTKAIRMRAQEPDVRGVPARLCQLAVLVVTNEPDELWWWSYRFTSWSARLTVALGEHHPSTVRLRNAPCPTCDSRSVIVISEDGPVVAPPLAIDFRDGAVRAASCSACGAMWWRGADLEHLAGLLGCRAVGVG
jgi:hypothetical protein